MAGRRGRFEGVSVDPPPSHADPLARPDPRCEAVYSIRTERCCRAANALFCQAANALLLLPMFLLCGRAASSAVSPRVTHPRPMARVHMSLCVRET